MAIFNTLKRKIDSALSVIYNLYDLRRLLLLQQKQFLQKSRPNPMNRYGGKVFSQADEDGITLEIVKRLGLQKNSVFAEFGVGDGTENNTLALAALGWKGYWVGGEDIAFKYPVEKKRFTLVKDWITNENICDLAQKGLSRIEEKSADVISLDLDGNDYYFVKSLLEDGNTPELFIVEYNSQFIPPIEFIIPYDPAHTWQKDDYYGASLQSFVNLFTEHDYILVCCNSHTGSNAFFVKKQYANAFSEVPDDLIDIYVEPNYMLVFEHGHKTSLKTIETIFNRD